MAIAFARMEFIQRSSGQNACFKSAYISRSRVEFEGTKFADSKVYNFSWKESVVHTGILLPENADSKFQDREILWNSVETAENRIDSSVAMEMVIALPDDAIVSVEDRVEMAESFVKEHITSKGLAAEIAVHPPEKFVERDTDSNKVQVKDHNWHAHILIPQRRFNEAGTALESKKPRNLFPQIRRGGVVEADQWGKLWAKHQNDFFASKGLDLRVDPTGIVAQKHMGPVRLRGAATEILRVNELLVEQNKSESLDPDKIIDKLLERASCFDQSALRNYIQRHAPADLSDVLFKEVLNRPHLVQLLDRKTGKPSHLFTSQSVLQEERGLLRNAKRIHSRSAFNTKGSSLPDSYHSLSQEQKQAFDGVIKGQRLSCLEGYAGTGKSHLMIALRDYYEPAGYTVRAFGPDSATASVLKEKGFDNAENTHQFLYGLKHNNRSISTGKEVWLIDESGKASNAVMSELLKKAEKGKAQLFLAGDSSQMQSVARGGCFQALCREFGSFSLTDIQRQKQAEQREIAKDLASGKVREAVDAIARSGGFHWHSDRLTAMEAMVHRWDQDQTQNPGTSSILIAHSNQHVRFINEMVRTLRKERGEIDSKELKCATTQGTIFVSEGDRIEFRRNDKKMGIINGTKGTLVSASENRFIVQIEEGNKARTVSFDPKTYNAFQLGYATSHYRSQGQTVDRAYVLYSRTNSMREFYVEMTRHTDKAYCFVPEQDARNLAILKMQVSSKNEKQGLQDLESVGERQSRLEKEDRIRDIDDLKTSEQLWSRLKGYGKEAIEKVKGKADRATTTFKDIRSDASFYQFDKEEQVPGKAERVIRRSSPENELPNNNPVQEEANEPSLKKDSSWKDLSADKREVLIDYFRKAADASDLFQLVKSESEPKGCSQEKTSSFEAWQKACGARNQQAHKVARGISSIDLGKVLSDKSRAILNTHAQRHTDSERRYEASKVDYNHLLKPSMESLLYKLFPDGPTLRTNRSLRFGTKGSLSVAISGDKIGQFYDFEEGKGGGPLGLIEHRLQFSRAEAIEWAKGFLGNSTSITVPPRARIPKSVDKELAWNPIKPPDKYPAPPISQISKLGHSHKETARYAYRDLQGNLLFYTVRLEPKTGGKSKQVLPLSYGKIGEHGDPSWRLKAYSSTSRPLYGQESLQKKPQSKVVIVEGEKAADAAQKMLADDGYTVITWMGGSGAVTKSDWSPLKGRDLIIWPDNDPSGFKAADSVSRELSNVGAKSVKVVDEKVLQSKFPEKWDLADPIPSAVKRSEISSLIQLAEVRQVACTKNGTNRQEMKDSGIER